MKRNGLAVLITALLLTGCASEATDKKTAAVESGTYLMDMAENDSRFAPEVEIDEDSFAFSCISFSSNGKWRLEDGRLALPDGNNTYYFTVNEDGSLTSLSNLSDWDERFEAPVEEGSVFRFTEEEQPDVRNVSVGGSLALYVDSILEDHVHSIEEAANLYVSEYQSTPFLMHVSKHVLSKVEAGKTYVFTIGDTDLSSLDKNMIERVLDYGVLFEMYDVEVVDAREAADGEMGMSSLSLKYEVKE